MEVFVRSPGRDWNFRGDCSGGWSIRRDERNGCDRGFAVHSQIDPTSNNATIAGCFAGLYPSRQLSQVPHT